MVIPRPDVPDPLLQRRQEAAARGCRTSEGLRPGYNPGFLRALPGPDHGQIDRQRAGDLEGLNDVRVIGAQLRPQKGFAADGAVGELPEVQGEGALVAHQAQVRSEVALDVLASML